MPTALVLNKMGPVLTFVPARTVRAVAAAGAPARLRRGVVLRLEAVREDRYWEGMGTNFWSIDDPDLVHFIHSALEGRWGGAAVLADGLVVPVGHPVAGDIARADRLVVDLQAITRAFRAESGLPTDGEVPSIGQACFMRYQPSLTHKAVVAP